VEGCHRQFKLTTNNSISHHEHVLYRLKLGYEPINQALDFGQNGARTYDRAHAPTKCQPTRSAKCTDILDANVTESFHEAYEFGFDIDTPTDIVQAHMRDQSGVIPKEAFGQLSPESRKAWSQLSNDIWVDILRALQVNGSQRSQ
jgi:hypothetical protein